MKSSQLIWAFIGCFASLSAHAQVTIIDAADYVAVMAETPEANEVSVGWGVTNLGGQTQYLMAPLTSMICWCCSEVFGPPVVDFHWATTRLLQNTKSYP